MARSPRPVTITCTLKCAFVPSVIKHYGQKRTTYRMLRDGDSRGGAFRESLSDFQIRVQRLVAEAQARAFSPFSR